MRFLVTCLAIGLGAASALANDSSSELAAGGVVLTRNDSITMQREDLTLAPDQVTVRYEMRNNTSAPITLRVAFPLPDVPVGTPAGKSVRGPDGKDIAYNVAMRDVTDPNYLGFFVSVDGKALTTETDIHAFLPDGRDIVKDLYRIGGWGLVLRPMYYEIDPTMRTVDAFDVGPTIHQALLKLHAVDGDAKAAMPLWSTRVTLHWMQTFKPGVTIVEHRYRPVIGSMLVASVGPDHAKVDAENGTWIGSGSADFGKDFCIAGESEAAFRALYRKLVATEAHKDGYLGGMTLGYILRTARNWAGPIGTFHLTIKSGDPAGGERDRTVGAISACTDFPLKETGERQWEATVTNYVPTRDLRILMLPDQ